MKIAILIRNFVTTGGAEHYTCEITKRIAEKHEVHVFCQTWDDGISDKIIFHKIPCPLPKPSFINQLIFSYFCGRAIDESFDIIHTHERVSRFDILTIHCPCYKGFITDTIGFWRRALILLSEFTSPRSLSYLWLEKKQFTRAPHRLLIADSHMVKDDVVRNYHLPEDYFKVAYPGVEIDEIERARLETNRQRLRNDYSIGEDDFLLLFVGTEFKRKGLDALLAAMAQSQKPRIKLLVVGNGDIQAYEQKAIGLGVRSRVIFAGLIKDIFPIYLLAEAFIMPTLSDPCPMAPLEAMASGTATVMSNKSYCGTAEHITHGEALILSDPRDAAELSRAIITILDDKKRMEISLKGRQLAAGLGWERTTAITLEAYARIAALKKNTAC